MSDEQNGKKPEEHTPEATSAEQATPPAASPAASQPSAPAAAEAPPAEQATPPAASPAASQPSAPAAAEAAPAEPAAPAADKKTAAKAPKEVVFTTGTDETLAELKKAAHLEADKLRPSVPAKGADGTDVESPVSAARVDAVIKGAEEYLEKTRSSFAVPVEAVKAMAGKMIGAMNRTGEPVVGPEALVAAAVIGNSNNADKAAHLTTVKQLVAETLPDDKKAAADKSLDDAAKVTGPKVGLMQNPNVTLAAAAAAVAVGAKHMFGKKPPKLDENGQEVPQHKSLVAKIGALVTIAVGVIAVAASQKARHEHRGVELSDFAAAADPRKWQNFVSKRNEGKSQGPAPAL